jgi:aminopeptidase YwaD
VRAVAVGAAAAAVAVGAAMWGGTGSAGGAAATNAAHRAAVFLARDVGSRPAASRAELRAHRWVKGRFERAGLQTTYVRFTVPGKGRSRNVVGVRRGDGRCLKVLMAHADSVPDGPGANDNASGVGVLVALAPRLDALGPPCEVWLVATGAEERPYTGSPDHLGALALVRHLRRRGAAGRLRFALSLDMVGRGTRFQLRSPHTRPRQGIERDVLAAGRRRGVRLKFKPDSGSGNSDHRELELAGLPALAMQVWNAEDACYHSSCDGWRRLQPEALARVQAVAESLLRRP